jgi:hypothetical protein
MIVEGENQTSVRNNREEQYQLQFRTQYQNFLSKDTMQINAEHISVANDLHIWALYGRGPIAKSVEMLIAYAYFRK